MECRGCVPKAVQKSVSFSPPTQGLKMMKKFVGCRRGQLSAAETRHARSTALCPALFVPSFAGDKAPVYMIKATRNKPRDLSDHGAHCFFIGRSKPLYCRFQREINYLPLSFIAACVSLIRLVMRESPRRLPRGLHLSCRSHGISAGHFRRIEDTIQNGLQKQRFSQHRHQ